MEEHMDDSTNKGFTIKDKRIFSQDTDKEKETKVADNSDTKPASSSPETNSTKPETKENEKTPPPLPGINFSSFIISLSSSAMFHFGEIPDPVTNKKQKNLPMAKQTIDILRILKEKTAGNLDKNEENLFDNLLHDLQIRYVNEAKTH